MNKDQLEAIRKIRKPMPPPSIRFNDRRRKLRDKAEKKDRRIDI